jgi:hypothetical protein
MYPIPEGSYCFNIRPGGIQALNPVQVQLGLNLLVNQNYHNQ